MGLLDQFGASRFGGGGGMSPITMGLLGLLAYRTMKGKGRLADILGTSAGTNTTASPGGSPVTGPSTGGLGAMLGAGAIGSGLRDLLDRFRGTNHEQTAQSWVSTGPNHPIAPGELEQVLGEERLQWLTEQTGLPRDQLLAGLSRELPHAVNELTPEGRLPTDDELARTG